MTVKLIPSRMTIKLLKLNLLFLVEYMFADQDCVGYRKMLFVNNFLNPLNL